MKGKIEIICDGRGVHLSVNVSEVGEHDSVFLTHALGKALGLGPHDYMVAAMAEMQGVLDEAGSPVAVTIDTEGLLKQMLEEEHEG